MKAHGTRTRACASRTCNSRTSMTMARLRCARCSRSKIACGLTILAHEAGDYSDDDLDSTAAHVATQGAGA